MDKKDYRVAVITLSDRAYSGERADLSGPTIQKLLSDNGIPTEAYDVIPDDGEMLKEKLLHYSDEGFHLILTTGGTGLSPRDITPETTLGVADKVVPGIAEAIRAESLKITKHAMISRGASVIRKNTLIINLPGSPKACTESIGVFIDILPHAIGLIVGEKMDK